MACSERAGIGTSVGVRVGVEVGLNLGVDEGIGVGVKVGIGTTVGVVAGVFLLRPPLVRRSTDFTLEASSWVERGLVI